MLVEVKHQCRYIKYLTKELSIVSESNDYKSVLLLEADIDEELAKLESLIESIVEKLNLIEEEEIKNPMIKVFEATLQQAEEIDLQTTKPRGFFAKMLKSDDSADASAGTKLVELVTKTEMNIEMLEATIKTFAKWMNTTGISDQDIENLSMLVEKLKSPTPTNESAYKMGLMHLLFEAPDDQNDNTTKKEPLEDEESQKQSSEESVEEQKIPKEILLGMFLFDFKKLDIPSVSELIQAGIEKKLLNEEAGKKLQKKLQKAINSSKRLQSSLIKTIEKTSKEIETSNRGFMSSIGATLFGASETTLTSEILVGTASDPAGLWIMSWNGFKTFAQNFIQDIAEKSEATLEDMRQGAIPEEAAELFKSGENYMKPMHWHPAFKDLKNQTKAQMALVLASTGISPKQIFGDVYKESFQRNLYSKSQRFLFEAPESIGDTIKKAFASVKDDLKFDKEDQELLNKVNQHWEKLGGSAENKNEKPQSTNDNIEDIQRSIEDSGSDTTRTVEDDEGNQAEVDFRQSVEALIADLESDGVDPESALDNEQQEAQEEAQQEEAGSGYLIAKKDRLSFWQNFISQGPEDIDGGGTMMGVLNPSKVKQFKLKQAVDLSNRINKQARAMGAKKDVFQESKLVRWQKLAGILKD